MNKFCFTAALVLSIGLSVSFGQGTRGPSKHHLIYKQPIPPSKAPPLHKEFNQQLFIENSHSSPPTQLNSIAFDSSQNGYGLSSSVQKSVDVQLIFMRILGLAGFIRNLSQVTPLPIISVFLNIMWELFLISQIFQYIRL